MIMLCRVQYFLFSVKKPGVRMLYCLVRAGVNLIQANSRFVRSWRVLTQKSNANLNYFTYDRSPLLNGLWFVMIMIMISPSSLSTHCIEQEFISLRSEIVPLSPHPHSSLVPLSPHPHSSLLTPHPLPLTSGLDMPRVATFSCFCVTVCGLSREIVCLHGCLKVLFHHITWELAADIFRPDEGGANTRNVRFWTLYTQAAWIHFGKCFC